MKGDIRLHIIILGFPGNFFTAKSIIKNTVQIVLFHDIWDFEQFNSLFFNGI